jgi:hypothetical protein
MFQLLVVQFPSHHMEWTIVLPFLGCQKLYFEKEVNAW